MLCNCLRNLFCNPCGHDRNHRPVPYGDGMQEFNMQPVNVRHCCGCHNNAFYEREYGGEQLTYCGHCGARGTDRPYGAFAAFCTYGRYAATDDLGADNTRFAGCGCRSALYYVNNI